MIHLRFDCLGAADYGEMRHAQQVFSDLKITYQLATPQSIADQWWFWNCKNIPEKLPKYITPLNLDPMTCIGYGLSKKDALELMENSK